MKKIILILALLVSGFCVKSQTVTDILTEQDGNNIIIKYKISESNNKQLFHITISCLVNEKDKIKLKAITGDVGDNIKGGKSEYKAVWNVLEDVDELNSAEFFIKSELKEDGSKIRIDPALSNNNRYVAFNSGIVFTQFGIKGGYMNNWGVYASLRFSPFGNYHLESYVSDEYGVYLLDIYGSEIPYIGVYSNDYNAYNSLLFSASAGFSKRILNNKFKLHAYLGAGYGWWGNYDEYETFFDDIYYEHYTENAYGNDDYGFETEIGLMGSHNHLLFSAGFAYKLGWYSNSGDLTLGIGYRF